MLLKQVQWHNTLKYKIYKLKTLIINLIIYFGFFFYIYMKTLVESNNLEDKVFIVAGKIEEIDLPEKVDVIISEPMGYMLYNERMLETYLHAKKWLKPGGKLCFRIF
jgi:hypothetical protein